MKNVLGKRITHAGVEGVVIVEYEIEPCDYKIMEGNDGLYYVLASSLLDSNQGWTKNWRVSEIFDNLDEALEYCCGFIPPRKNYANLRFAENLLLS